MIENIIEENNGNQYQTSLMIPMAVNLFLRCFGQYCQSSNYSLELQKDFLLLGLSFSQINRTKS